MIKNYKLFTEGILDKLKGPSYEDALKTKSPNKLLKICFNNLDDNGVEYALEHGASKELYDNLIKMKEWFLDLIVNLEEFKSVVYPDIIFWKKDNEILFEQDLNSMNLIVNFNKIWSIFINKYNYKHTDIQIFIKNITEEYLDWYNFTPIISGFIQLK